MRFGTKTRAGHGDPEATDKAIQNFETALIETPNDAITIHALAVMYARKGRFVRVLELLVPLNDHPSPKTRELVKSLLLLSYERTGEMLKAAELRAEGVKPWGML